MTTSTSSTHFCGSGWPRPIIIKSNTPTTGIRRRAVDLVRRELVRPRHDLTAPRVTNVLLLATLCDSFALAANDPRGMAEHGIRGVHAIRAAARWSPFGRVARSSSILKVSPLRAINPQILNASFLKSGRSFGCRPVGTRYGLAQREVRHPSVIAKSHQCSGFLMTYLAESTATAIVLKRPPITAANWHERTDKL